VAINKKVYGSKQQKRGFYWVENLRRCFEESSCAILPTFIVINLSPGSSELVGYLDFLLQWDNENEINAR